MNTQIVVLHDGNYKPLRVELHQGGAVHELPAREVKQSIKRDKVETEVVLESVLVHWIERPNPEPPEGLMIFYRLDDGFPFVEDVLLCLPNQPPLHLNVLTVGSFVPALDYPLATLTFRCPTVWQAK